MLITLCGSTRFESEFIRLNEKLSMMGHTVISLSVMPSTKPDREWYDDDQKETLDLVHLHKILISESLVIINKNGYIGDSTKREIKWASMLGKPIYWLEPDSITDLAVGDLKPVIW